MLNTEHLDRVFCKFKNRLKIDAKNQCGNQKKHQYNGGSVTEINFIGIPFRLIEKHISNNPHIVEKRNNRGNTGNGNQPYPAAANGSTENIKFGNKSSRWR